MDIKNFFIFHPLNTTFILLPLFSVYTFLWMSQVRLHPYSCFINTDGTIQLQPNTQHIYLYSCEFNGIDFIVCFRHIFVYLNVVLVYFYNSCMDYSFVTVYKYFQDRVVRYCCTVLHVNYVLYGSDWYTQIPFFWLTGRCHFDLCIDFFIHTFFMDK